MKHRIVGILCGFMTVCYIHGVFQYDGSMLNGLTGTGGRILVVAAAMLSGLASWAGAQPAPGFYALTPYNDGVGVSDNYTVLVGRAGNSAGALWHLDGSLQPINLSSPTRLSANGLVAAGNPAGGPARLVVPLSLTILPTPVGGNPSGSSANAVSGDGSMVVGYDAGLRHGWYWTSATGTVVIPTSGNANALDVSRDGRWVVGGMFDSTGRAFAYDLTTNAATYLTPGTAQGIQLRRIQGDGLAAVGYSFTGGSSGQTGSAFKWSASAGFTAIPPIPCPRGTTTDAFQSYRPDAVNADGTVVGGTQGGRAWIWTASSGTRDLKNVMMDQLGFNLAGWTLWSVYDISADGRVLVGNGSLNGTSTAYVAVIPNPLPPAAADGFSASLPVNGAVAVALRPTLSWTAMPFASQYRVSITPSGGTTTELTTSATSVVVPAGVLGNCQSVAWSVSATTPCGFTGMSLGVATFETLKPADFNHDGHVQIADVFAFLDAWFAGSASADVNGIGGLTVADVYTFLDLFFLGCS
jgi:uncharacterized membrane protein